MLHSPTWSAASNPTHRPAGSPWSVSRPQAYESPESADGYQGGRLGKDRGPQEIPGTRADTLAHMVVDVETQSSTLAVGACHEELGVQALRALFDSFPVQAQKRSPGSKGMSVLHQSRCFVRDQRSAPNY